MEEIKEVEEKEPWYKGPIKYILGIFLLLLIVLMVLPYYTVKLDPEPKKIPAVEEVLLTDVVLSNKSFTLKTRQDFIEFLDPTEPVIKQAANKIVSVGCERSRVCNAKAIYYFVRDNIQYVNDPVNFEYIEEPREVLVTKAADCESGTMLMASLMESIGIDSELVFIPGHAFLRIKLDDALKRYKQDGYVYLDWTCKICSFGEIPYQNVDAHKEFLDVY